MYKVIKVEMFVGRNDITRMIERPLSFQAERGRMYLFAQEGVVETNRAFICTATEGLEIHPNMVFIGTCTLAPGMQYHLFEGVADEKED